jgi:hypothetical protein
MLLKRVQKLCHSTFTGFTNPFMNIYILLPLTTCASIYVVREDKKREER